MIDDVDDPTAEPVYCTEPSCTKPHCPNCGAHEPCSTAEQCLEAWLLSCSLVAPATRAKST